MLSAVIFEDKICSYSGVEREFSLSVDGSSVLNFEGIKTPRPYFLSLMFLIGEGPFAIFSPFKSRL